MSHKIDPKESIVLLNELIRCGFNDELYGQLHHFRDNKRKDTIGAHIRYCEKTAEFKIEGNNALLQHRLRLIRGKIGVKNGAREILDRPTFQRLIKEALQRYPL